MALPGLINAAKQKGLPLPPQLEDPNFHLTTNLAFHAQQLLFKRFWPQLGPEGESLDQIKAIVAQDLADATKPEKPAS